MNEKESKEEVEPQIQKRVSNEVTGGLVELIRILQDQSKRIKDQDALVESTINEMGSNAILLRDAKTKALKNEHDLLESISGIFEMSKFLENIIKIQNKFDKLYSPLKEDQEKARKKYAPNIIKYEDLPKPTSKVESFVSLMFAGASVHLSTFSEFIKKLEKQCEKDEIKIVKCTGAHTKNIQRAFYKSYYVYKGSHAQMTDVLRCSFIFDSFDSLYQAFSCFENMVKNDKNIKNGILRVKDRFQSKKMPFGYRDMLVNINCPGTEIVCEIQFHHEIFYKNKEESHYIYKRARLFEMDDGDNLAYNYAVKHVQKKIGDAIFNGKIDDEDNLIESKDDKKKHKHDNDGKEGDVDDDDDDNDTKKEKIPLYQELLTKWGLSDFANKFEENGYDDVSVWPEIQDEELKDFGLKAGHIKRFHMRLKEYLDEETKKEKKEKSKKKDNDDNDNDADDGSDNGDDDDIKKKKANFSEAHNGYYLSGYANGVRTTFNSLDKAKAKCIEINAGGITFVPYDGLYELRAGKDIQKSPSGEVSWVYNPPKSKDIKTLFSQPNNGCYLSSWVNGIKVAYPTLEQAMKKCTEIGGGGVTWVPYEQHYEVRASRYLAVSPSGEISWVYNG